MTEKKEISENTLIIFGVIGGLLGIYIGGLGGYVNLNSSILQDILPTIAGIGAICAAVWGAMAVKNVAQYGLGTGVPSIGQLALGMGIVASIFGLAIADEFKIFVAGPIIALITAAIIGFIMGWFAQNVIKMNIPVMIKGMTQIAASGSLIIIGLSTAISGSFILTDLFQSVFDTGFILVVLWMGAMAILHSFNSNLGPDEKQKRSIYHAAADGATAVVVVGIAAIMTLGISGVITLLVGVIIWLIYYKKFWTEVYKDSYSVVGTGLLPETEA